jgi:hypothetical protein
MQRDDILTDITFVVQGTSVKAHRNVMGSHGGHLRQLVQSGTDRVEISEEIQCHTFKMIMR